MVMPVVSEIECVEFTYPVANQRPAGDASHPVYRPGSSIDRPVLAVRITADTGPPGEFVSLNSPPGPAIEQIDTIAPYLVGKNPLHRERHWSVFKLNLRKYDRMGIGPIDIALWDLAGKHHDAAIHELLGTYRDRLPAYASTAFADDNGGLDSPDAYADFAEQCRDLGYQAFKAHGWRAEDDPPEVDREIALVRTLGDRVGEEMVLMYDAVGQLETFADAYRVGRGCDEHGYLWLEDPYRDMGTSQHGSKRLRALLSTPLLQTEHVRGLEPHTDFAVNEATDFLRADPEYDAGITGTMKIARVAEGLGLDVELHLCGPAQRQCMASIRNSNYYEVGLAHPDHPTTHNPPVYTNGYSDALDAINTDGTYPVPPGPGLGVEYDWDYIHDQAVRTKTYSA